MSVLVIGYGNPGRMDDGLGPAFAQQIENLGLPDVVVESNYQLNIEDAELISHYDLVILADASTHASPPFDFHRLTKSDAGVSFSSHSITANALLGLAEELFDAAPEAFAMAIRGYNFNDFDEILSTAASDNLEAAVSFFIGWIENVALNA